MYNQSIAEIQHDIGSTLFFVILRTCYIIMALTQKILYSNFQLEKIGRLEKLLQIEFFSTGSRQNLSPFNLALATALFQCQQK